MRLRQREITVATETDKPAYRGIHHYKMDSKYRVSVQTAWRPKYDGSFFLMFAHEEGHPIIKVLTEEAFKDREKRIEESDKTVREKAKLLEKLSMLCREASLNDQGKLLIPKDLSQMADIQADAEVVVVGRGLHFEVWNKVSFQNYLDAMNAHEAEDDLAIFS